MPKSLSTEDRHISAAFVRKVAESGASSRFVKSLVERISEDDLKAHKDEAWLVKVRASAKR